MTATVGTGDDGISAETRRIAAGAMIRAATSPQAAQIGQLAAEALSEKREDMTPAEIRALAATALGQAQQINLLMTRLADLLDGGMPDGSHG